MSYLEFNLLPEEFRRPEREIRLRLWGVVLAGVAVVVIGDVVPA